MHQKRARSTAIAITVALLAAIAVAACGSSATTGSNTSGSSAAANAATSRTKLAACLKQHGVTLPSRAAGGKPPAGGAPDGVPGGTPPGGGYGGGGTPPAAGAGGPGVPGGAAGPQSSKFRAAFKACGADFGGGQFRRGGGPGAKPTAAALAKFTACVDAHGYKLPKANTSGNGPIFPKRIESNKTFEAAAKACQADLRPSGGASSSSSSAAAD